MNDLYIYDTSSASVYSILPKPATEEEQQKAIDKARAMTADRIKLYTQRLEEYGPVNNYYESWLKAEKKRDFKVLNFDELMQAQREFWLSKEATETTEAEFFEMLEVLPPLKWTTQNGFEMFCMSEFTSGCYTTQFAHHKETDKYYCATVSPYDRETWIDNLPLKGAANNEQRA